jgi:hypothetical protein
MWSRNFSSGGQQRSRRPRRMILAQVPLEQIDQRPEPGVGRLALIGELDQTRVGPALGVDEALRAVAQTLYITAHTLYGTCQISDGREGVTRNRGQAGDRVGNTGHLVRESVDLTGQAINLDRQPLEICRELRLGGEQELHGPLHLLRRHGLKFHENASLFRRVRHYPIVTQRQARASRLPGGRVSEKGAVTSRVDVEPELQFRLTRVICSQGSSPSHTRTRADRCGSVFLPATSQVLPPTTQMPARREFRKWPTEAAVKR